MFYLHVRIVLGEDKVTLLLFLPPPGFILSLPVLTSVSAHNAHCAAKPALPWELLVCQPGGAEAPGLSHTPSPASLQLLAREELMANCVERLLINSFSAGAVPMPHELQQSDV